MRHQLVSRRLVPGFALAGVVALAAVTAGCSTSTPSSDTTGSFGTLQIEPPSVTATAPVPEVEPVADGPCPYLSADEVEKLNGEKVKTIETDNRIDPPACFFTGSDGKIQLTTTVYTVGSASEASALVDKSVPVSSSERAEAAGGWSGGKNGGPSGALLALANENRVLVVHSVQQQSIKVQRIADLVAPRLS